MMRADASTIGYDTGIVTSDRFDDVYVVVPFTQNQSDGGPFDLNGISPIPISGNYNDFYAFTLYTQVDRQANSSINSLDVQIAPQTHLAEVDADFMGLAKLKMLSISPEPDNSPVLLTGSLARTGK
jgi:hypothetical protein